MWRLLSYFLLHRPHTFSNKNRNVLNMTWEIAFFNIMRAMFRQRMQKQLESNGMNEKRSANKLFHRGGVSDNKKRFSGKGRIYTQSSEWWYLVLIYRYIGYWIGAKREKRKKEEAISFRWFHTLNSMENTKNTDGNWTWLFTFSKTVSGDQFSLWLVLVCRVVYGAIHSYLPSFCINSQTDPLTIALKIDSNRRKKNNKN